MGNRTAENTYDPSSTLHRTHTRVFNTLNELYQDINAAGTSAVTTTFTYDNNGNVFSSAAPLSRNTADQYDALNRLKQITDPNSGITKFSYDAQRQSRHRHRSPKPHHQLHPQRLRRRDPAREPRHRHELQAPMTRAGISKQRQMRAAPLAHVLLMTP